LAGRVWFPGGGSSLPLPAAPALRPAHKYGLRELAGLDRRRCRHPDDAAPRKAAVLSWGVRSSQQEPRWNADSERSRRGAAPNRTDGKSVRVARTVITVCRRSASFSCLEHDQTQAGPPPASLTVIGSTVAFLRMAWKLGPGGVARTLPIRHGRDKPA